MQIKKVLATRAFDIRDLRPSVSLDDFRPYNKFPGRLPQPACLRQPDTVAVYVQARRLKVVSGSVMGGRASRRAGDCLG
jgi:hypothetical protein